MGTDIPAKAVWLEKRESGVAFIVRKQFLMVIKCSHVCVCVCVCVCWGDVFYHCPPSQGLIWPVSYQSPGSK